MVYSAEDRAKMQQFFEGRVSGRLESRLAKVSRSEISKDGTDSLRRFESEVDRLNGEKVQATTGAGSQQMLADYLIRKSASHRSSLNRDYRDKMR